MLCFSHIKDLMTRIGRAADMTEEDQSIHSNGDKAICKFFCIIEIQKLTIGIFQILYKEVPEIDPNLSIDDDRSACSDSWFRLFEEEEDVSKEGLEKQDGSNSEVVAIIANDNIKPHTLYAVYVMTKMVRHEGARNAVSSIAFVRTRYGQPDPPRITKIEATDTDKIRVEWDPPAQPNGDITHYILSWRPRDEDVDDAAVTFCQHSRDISGTRYLPSDIDAGLGTTPDPHLASVLISGGSTDIPPTDTCSSIKGCCECSPKLSLTCNPGGRSRDTGSEKQEQAEFENAVHNVVFIQRRVYRSFSMHQVIQCKDYTV
uniref:Fibronectin type-III domain-containing protein n=1 Tax=Heterorhabditis bacteriophora TaxID=37862 RepID=A0A1I7XBP2_HETBA